MIQLILWLFLCYLTEFKKTNAPSSSIPLLHGIFLPTVRVLLVWQSTRRKGKSSSSSSTIRLRPLSLFLPPGNHLPISFVVFIYFFSLQVCNLNCYITTSWFIAWLELNNNLYYKYIKLV